MDMVRNPKDRAIIGRDAHEQPTGKSLDQPNTDDRCEQGDLEIEFEFESEMPEEGGEA